MGLQKTAELVHFTKERLKLTQTALGSEELQGAALRIDDTKTATDKHLAACISALALHLT